MYVRKAWNLKELPTINHEMITALEQITSEYLQ